MRSGKAGGTDGIAFEFCRGAFLADVDANLTHSPIENLLLKMFNTILHSGKYPEAWRLATLIPLVKSGIGDVTYLIIKEVLLYLML